jgi:hypothetical protein
MRIDINFSSSFRLTVKSASKWSSKQRLTDLDSNKFLSKSDGPANHTGSNIGALYRLMTKKLGG